MGETVNSVCPDVRFARDAAEWKHDSLNMSSVSDMVLLPSYQRIIGLGPAAVPLIMEDLRKGLWFSDEGPDHWFWALTAIVGEDHASGCTTVKGAAQAWIAWWDGETA